MFLARWPTDSSSGGGEGSRGKHDVPVLFVFPTINSTTTVVRFFVRFGHWGHFRQEQEP